MTAPHPFPPPRLGESLVSRCARFLEHNLEHYKSRLLVCLSLIYFLGVVLYARSKPFWHDELYSVMLSRLGFPALWRAISSGADGHPLMINLLVKAVELFAPEGEVSARIPAMIGFWVFCLCLFRFVNRRLGVLYAFPALFLPFGTGAFYFATECRSYGPLLGFFGIALVCWQAAAENRGRVWALPGLAACLGCVTFSHYYGGFVYVPLAAGELYRALRRPVLDWRMYGAMAAGLFPIAAYYPLARNLSKYSVHPWNGPRIGDLYLFYKTEFANELVSAAVFLALAALYFSFGKSPSEADKSNTSFRDGAMPGYEVIAVVFLAALPVFCITASFLVTHAFSDRYALTAVGGGVLLSIVVVWYLARGNRVIGGILLLASMLPYVFALVLHQGRFHAPLDTEPLLRQAIESGPVAIDDGPLFFQTWYYLPPEWKRRVYYVADPRAAADISGSDSVDMNFLIAQPWIPGFPVVPYRTAAGPGATIMIYHSATVWSWLPAKLLGDGARIEVTAADRDRSILRATLPSR